MTKKIGSSCFLVLLVSFSSLRAQNAQITGSVVDGITGKSIPFAQIQIENSNFACKADSSGNFSLKNLPEQEVSVVFSATGYEVFVMKVNLDEKKNLSVKAQLRPLVYFDSKKAEVNLSEPKPDNSYSSILKNPDLVFEGDILLSMTQASYTFDSFLQRISYRIPGARYDNGVYFMSSSARALRPQAALVLVNGTYITDNYNSLPFLPRDIVRVEVYKPTSSGAAILGSRGAGGAINLFIKK